jgi:hypothetical protein
MEGEKYYPTSPKTASSSCNQKANQSDHSSECRSLAFLAHFLQCNFGSFEEVLQYFCLFPRCNRIGHRLSARMHLFSRDSPPHRHSKWKTKAHCLIASVTAYFANYSPLYICQNAFNFSDSRLINSRRQGCEPRSVTIHYSQAPQLENQTK